MRAGKMKKRLIQWIANTPMSSNKNQYSNINAYCLACSKAVEGKVNKIEKLKSGNYLYIGECSLCSYEIKRIVRPKS